MIFIIIRKVIIKLKFNVKLYRLLIFVKICPSVLSIVYSKNDKIAGSICSNLMNESWRSINLVEHSFNYVSVLRSGQYSLTLFLNTSSHFGESRKKLVTSSTIPIVVLTGYIEHDITNDKFK